MPGGLKKMPKTEKADEVRDRLDRLRQAVKDARDEKVRLEERASAKAEEREKILAELTEMGVAEGDLDSTIAKLSKKLDDELNKAEQIVSAAEPTDPIAAAAAAGEFTEDDSAGGGDDEFDEF